MVSIKAAGDGSFRERKWARGKNFVSPTFSELLLFTADAVHLDDVGKARKFDA